MRNILLPLKEGREQLVVGLFDLTGYTRFIQDLGHVTTKIITDRHNEICISIIKEFEGIIIKENADGVLCIFRDFEKSCHAAIKIKNVIMNEKILLDDSCEISISTKGALSAGLVEIFKKDDNYDVMGDTVVRCHRMTDVANPNVVLTDNVLYHSVKTFFTRDVRFGKPIPLTLKGMGEVEVHEISDNKVGFSYDPAKQTSQQILNDRQAAGKIHVITTLLKNDQKITIFLMCLVSVSAIIAMQFFLTGSEDLDYSLDTIKTQIEKKVYDIWSIEDEVKTRLEDKLGNNPVIMSNTTLPLLITPQNNNTISEILGITFISNQDIKYIFLAASKNENCSTLFYKPDYQTYNRTTDFAKRDWCKELEKRSDYLTVTYYAPGPSTFVNTLSTWINITPHNSTNDKNPETQLPYYTVGYLGAVINWERNLQQMLTEINLDTVSLVLVDPDGHIASDCFKEDRKITCNNFQKNLALQIPPDFNIANYTRIGLLEKDVGFDPIQLPVREDIVNPKLLDNWHLYMIYQENIGQKIIPLLLFGLALASLSLLGYRYINLKKTSITKVS
jgi:class 3 adenylate cyclase